MNNIDAKLEGNILTLKIDISKRFGPSPSGKTLQVASSQGNVKIPETPADFRLGVNAYVKNPDYKGE